MDHVVLNNRVRMLLRSAHDGDREEVEALLRAADLPTDVPATVQQSKEFRGACPASAVAMRSTLDAVKREGQP